MNNFDFEQNLLKCWCVTDDIDTLCRGVLENNLTTDQIANALLGMKELYELRFNTLFENFEGMLKEQQQAKQGTYPTVPEPESEEVNPRWPFPRGYPHEGK